MIEKFKEILNFNFLGQNYLLIRSFNISENYRNFITDHKTSEFKFINSIKFYTIVMVMMAHCFMIFFYLPTKNPEFIEEVRFYF